MMKEATGSGLAGGDANLLKKSVLACLIGLYCAVVYSSFQATKTEVVEKLSAVAVLAEHDIRPLLLEDKGKDSTGTLETAARKYSIDGIELYSIDGMVIASYGAEVENTPSSMMLGEHVSVGFPFQLKVQYSRIVLHDDRPLGLLILYADMSQSMIPGAVVLLLGAFFIVQALRKESPARHGGASRAGEHPIDVDVAGGESPAEKRLRQRLAELEGQRDQALLSARAKGDFLASMSHEIRTSMNGVVGVLSLLEKSGFTGEKKRLLNAAVRSADSLLLVINDILDFSKIESGRMEFEKIEFELREIVEECIALYIDTAGSKNVRLHCYLPLDISTRVLGDPTRLRQIITNLLSNAVKFTEEGEVSFRVALLSEKNGEQRLRFTVEDTGIGIARDRLDQLFDMFTQAGVDTTRKYGGTGLGLNVCKKLVEMQGGEIGVKSHPGQGSIFWFVLGFETVAQSPVVPFFQEMRDKRVVIFDNCETCATVVSQYLRSCQVLSRSARDSNSILEYLRAYVEDNPAPDILLVDYHLIAAATERFISRIFSLYGEAAPELYVLSRQGGIGEMLRRKGVSGVIYKPVRLLQLYEELGGEAALREAPGGEQSRQLAGSVLLVDDEHINQHVGEMILKKLGLEVDIAASGKETLGKIDENDYDLILMDVQMPGMDGIRTTEMIRSREFERGEPARTIIAMTANALPSVKERCLASGMNGFLTKPIKPEVLVRYLQPYFPVRGKNDAACESDVQTGKTVAQSPEENEENAGRTADLPVWDRQLALEYVGGDEGLLGELMELFIERKELLLAAIEASMQTEDGEGISCAAHAFKGAVNHFAAGKCQQLAYAIEDRAGQGILDGLTADLANLRREADLLVAELERQRG